MHLRHFFALVACTLALPCAACGSLFLDSTPISYWTLRPAEAPLSGVRVLNLAPRASGPESQLAERLRADLSSTERFTFDGGVSQALVTVSAQAVDVDTQVEAETAQQGLTTLTRYTRHVSYTLRGTLQAMDGMTSRELANIRREVAASHACGTATLPGLPMGNGQQPDPSIFPASENCTASSEAIGGLARQLAQSLVPHYEMETAELYTEELEHASQAAQAFSKGNWTEAEALARVDLEQANAQSNRERQDRASYNLTVLLSATGQLDAAEAQLKTAEGKRSGRFWELAELSIQRAREATTQAAGSSYAPHHLPAL